MRMLMKPLGAAVAWVRVRVMVGIGVRSGVVVDAAGREAPRR